MTHSFNSVPFNFIVLIAIFLGQHIDSFPNNLYMFDKSIEDYGIRSHFLKGVIILVIKQHVNGIQDVI